MARGHRYGSRHEVAARIHGASMSAHLEAMTEAYDNARKLQEARTTRVPGELSFHTHWESPEALREMGSELDRAEAENAAHRAAHLRWYRAQMGCYSHTCYRAVRMTVARPVYRERLSLRQVSALLAGSKREPDPPPTALAVLSNLVTVHGPPRVSASIPETSSA